MTTLTEFFRAFGSAVRAAAAVEGGHAPARGDLQRLGISPKAFAAIRRN